MTTTLRATLYGRVSQLRGRKGKDKEREDGSRSVDQQLDHGRARCASQRWPIVGEYRDDGISASRFANGKVRPDWQKVMDQITAKAADVLVVWEIGRAHRDRMVWAALIGACIDHDVLMDVGGKTHDPNDPDDGFMLDLQSALAVRESGVTSKRVLRDVADRAALGKAHGTHRYGYKTIYDPKTGAPLQRVIHPERATIVREVADRMLAGESVYSITNDLNRRGVPTSAGKQWRGVNLTKMMRSPTYIARRIHRREDIGPADWPPILTPAQHHGILALLADPARGKYRQDTRVRYLGVGIYRCGVCGGRIRVLVDKRKSKPEKYSCAERFCIGRSVVDVDRLVEVALLDALSSPEVVAFLARTDADSDVQAAADEAIALHCELDALSDDVGAGRLSRATLLRIEPQLRARIEDAERRARPRRLPAAVFEVAGPEAEKRWDALSITDKRAILAALLDVRIARQGKGKHQFDPNTIKVRWHHAEGVPTEW